MQVWSGTNGLIFCFPGLLLAPWATITDNSGRGNYTDVTISGATIKSRSLFVPRSDLGITGFVGNMVVNATGARLPVSNSSKVNADFLTIAYWDTLAFPTKIQNFYSGSSTSQYTDYTKIYG